MKTAKTAAQIIVLDAGGQYCHLIARKVRDLGVYSEVVTSETPAADLAGAKGLIISGGPNSVYDPSSPTVDPAIFQGSARVLGICYGQQLMAYLLGGTVQLGQKGEYGLASFELLANGAGGGSMLFQGISGRQQIWMSHRDLVSAAAARISRFWAARPLAPSPRSRRRRAASTPCSSIPRWRIPSRGREILSNFLFGICGCRRDWDPRHRVPQIEDEIRECVGGRNVFFFVSGGVDSTVACALCQRALGPARVQGVYVDTGLMREGETDSMRAMAGVSVESAEAQFLGALAGVRDPEQKRHIIGEEFVRVQERIIESRHLLDGHWILGQGTIYPDTIESGGTRKSRRHQDASQPRTGHPTADAKPAASWSLCALTIRTKCARSAGSSGFPAEILDRHPFPGPGLAIRCLCSEIDAACPSHAR